MIIRKMNPKDADEVFKMMREFYDSPAVFHTSSDSVLKKDIEDCIGENPFVEGFVFEEQGELLGYAMTAPSYTTEYGGVCIWVEDLFIKPDHRHKGLGSLFFSYLEQQYPHAVRFKLEVEQENKHAIDAYLKKGYDFSPYFEMTKEMTRG